MNIYNKMTLIVILIATIAVSFTFYLFQKEDNPNKDALYENKIADHKTPKDKKRLWGCFKQLYREAGRRKDFARWWKCS